MSGDWLAESVIKSHICYLFKLVVGCATEKEDCVKIARGVGEKFWVEYVIAW